MERSRVVNNIEWPKGDFYSCTDPERLTHEEPWEAIEEYLDGNMTPRMTVAEVEAMILDGSLTVTAYVPMPITEGEIKRWSESLTEQLEEFFGEEHADPDGEDPLCEKAEDIMLRAVTKIVKASHNWSCQESGTIELTGEQVLALAREERPDWFEEVTP
jgi:hypothetical protein